MFADIHSNIDALEAVLDFLDGQRVDSVLCAGDVVGYGACPAECVERLRERNIPTVQGNHDRYAVDKESVMVIRASAREAIFWTRDQLSEEQCEWLATLPLRLDFEDYTVVHCSNSPSPHWPYVNDELSAAQNFLFQRHRVCFNAHTHIPLYARHREGHKISMTPLRGTLLPKNHRLLVGVGSVGQPRDGDTRAAVVIYDQERSRVELFRIRYDIAVAQARIRKAGLPGDLANRLAVGV